MELLRPLFAGFLFCFPLYIQAQIGQLPELTPREIARKAFPSVVLLVTEDADGKPKSLGSGFFISSDLVATNQHVIRNASSIYAKLINKKVVYEVIEVVATDSTQDLAILKLKNANEPALKLSALGQVEIGDGVCVVGNPEGLEGTLSQGIVSALRGNKLIQITAPLSQGSSGSPALNSRGEVIGIAVGSKSEGQNLNFAVPVSYLAALIQKSVNAPRLLAPNQQKRNGEKTAIGVPGGIYSPSERAKNENAGEPPPPPPPVSSPPNHSATPPPPPTMQRVSGGVLQNNAITKVQPPYPAIAKAARAAGAVQVAVTVSEEGRVISAEAVTGHPLLKEAAVAAAKQWLFRPLTISDVPVKMQGILTFIFTLIGKSDAKSVKAYFDKAEKLSYQRRYAESIVEYHEAIKGKPDYAEAYLGLGKAYHLVGSYDLAIKAFQASIKYGSLGIQVVSHQIL